MDFEHFWNMNGERLTKGLRTYILTPSIPLPPVPPITLKEACRETWKYALTNTVQDSCTCNHTHNLTGVCSVHNPYQRDQSGKQCNCGNSFGTEHTSSCSCF